MKIARKFTKSHLAASALKERSNKSIVIPVITRWSYIAITYKRILEVFDDINVIAGQRKWQKISAVDRDLMQLVVEIVEPFKEVTDKLQGDTLTLSWVYPGIMALIEMLEVSFLILALVILLVEQNKFARHSAYSDRFFEHPACIRHRSNEREIQPKVHSFYHCQSRNSLFGPFECGFLN